MPPYVSLLEKTVVNGLLSRLTSTFGLTSSQEIEMDFNYGGNDWHYEKFEKIGSGSDGIAFRVTSKLDRQFYVAKAKRARNLGMKTIKEWAAIVNL